MHVPPLKEVSFVAVGTASPLVVGSAGVRHRATGVADEVSRWRGSKLAKPKQDLRTETNT
jgi:hypothetical protein